MRLMAIQTNDLVFAGRIYEITSINGNYVTFKKRKHCFVGMRGWFEKKP